MEARRDLLVGILVVVGASLVLAFLSIGVFVRMTPAIEDIVEKNVHSLEASRAMMAVFADRLGEGVGEGGVARLEAALERLRGTVAGDDERLMLERVVDTMGRALYGERESIRQFLAAVAEVSELDYREMREADAEAQRLGAAGAWAAAIGGLVVALLAIAVYVRLERRVARPAEELARVLAAARLGDDHRRCRPLEGAQELEEALTTVNLLLDRDARREAAPVATDRAAGADDADARRALVHLLDHLGGAALVWRRGGGLVAASAAALEVLAGEGGAALRERAAAAVEGGEAVGLGDALFMYRLAPLDSADDGSR